MDNGNNNNNNYMQSFSSQAAPSVVYRAITEEMPSWWSAVTANFKKLGDEATVSFMPDNPSVWSFKATVLEEPERIELQCNKAKHSFEGMPDRNAFDEWLGTTLRFEIKAEGSGSKLLLTHIGLTPKLHCYNECKQGWDFFFKRSLKLYLDTGIGEPHRAG